MSWFSDALTKVLGTEQQDYLVCGPIALVDGSEDQAPLVDDGCYFDVSVASLRIPKSRVFTGKLYGAVHTYVGFATRGKEDAQVAHVVAPNALKNIDAAHLDRLVNIDERVAGPIPWRGDLLKIEMGLFSVKGADLTSPFLDTMTFLSQQAGIGFVSQATAFAPAIRKGIELLSGKDGACAFEIGISRSHTTPTTGYYVVVTAPKGALDPKDLRIDPNDKKLLFKGEPLTQYAYLVYRIGSLEKKADFGAIPEISAAYTDCQSAIRTGNQTNAEEALKVFRRIVLTSPDLISKDARRLVDIVKDMMTEIFSEPARAAKPNKPSPNLEDLKLY